MVETRYTDWTEISFVGGALCLDFVNTVVSRPATDRDGLRSYEDLLRWSVAAGSLTRPEAGDLHKRATEAPDEARRALEQARSIRESMFDVLKARIGKAALPAQPMTRINAALGEAMAHLRLTGGSEGIDWTWEDPDAALDRPLWPVLRSMADVMTEAPIDRLRLCASDRCDWLFLDTSKNGKRCWCDMSVCGNRAKATRHYNRRKEG